jgi:hypothetical protein
LFTFSPFSLSPSSSKANHWGCPLVDASAQHMHPSVARHCPRRVDIKINRPNLQILVS